MNKVLLAFTIFALFSPSLMGQTPINFEFLDHSARTTEARQIKVLSDKIAYTSPRGIYEATYDHDLNFINGFGRFAQSKLIEVNDSTFHMLQWEPTDGDAIGIPGFDYYTIKGDNKTTGTLGNNFQSSNHLHPIDISQDTCLLYTSPSPRDRG